MKKILDFYLRYPYIFDFFIVIIVYVCIKLNWCSLSNLLLINSINTNDIVSNLIGTCVSLAGFILAALTIIVTFKSNLKIKGLQESDNALDLIFASVHYRSIVKVYKDAILEFVLIAFTLYMLWLFSNSMSITTQFIVTATGILLTALSMLRSLLVLFKILNLDKYTLEEKRR